MGWYYWHWREGLFFMDVVGLVTKSRVVLVLSGSLASFTERVDHSRRTTCYVIAGSDWPMSRLSSIYPLYHYY